MFLGDFCIDSEGPWKNSWLQVNGVVLSEGNVVKKMQGRGETLVRCCYNVLRH